MFFQCWADVEDGGPTLKQHWVNVSCFLDNVYLYHIKEAGKRVLSQRSNCNDQYLLHKTI